MAVLHHMPQLDLDVDIVSARDLRNRDLFGKSDPYCFVEIEGRPEVKQRTKVIENCLDPVWNERFRVKDCAAEDVLKFTVFDRDRFSSDDLLGQLTLPVDQFLPNGHTGDWPLVETGKSKSFLKLSIVPVSDSEARPSFQFIVRPTSGAKVHCVRFDREDPLSKQVRGLCELLGLVPHLAHPGVEEGDEYVLTRTIEHDIRVLFSIPQLLSVGTPIDLKRAEDVVRERLDAVRRAPKEQLASKLRQLLQVISPDASSGSAMAIARELVDQGAFNTLVEKCDPHEAGITELAMSCLLCLMVKDIEIDEFNDKWIYCLLSGLFPQTGCRMADESASMPHATLSVLMKILMADNAAAAVHLVAKGEGEDGAGGVSLYPRIAHAWDGDDAFRACAASLVVSTLVKKCAAVDQEEVLAEITDGRLDYDPAEIIEDTNDHFVDTVLMTLQLSTVELVSGTQATERLWLQTELKHLRKAKDDATQRSDALSANMRRYQKAMLLMVAFMKLEGANTAKVLKVLPSIVRFGWDSMAWRRGYTLLHYACECIADPGVVDLVATLCSDIDARDSHGMRAIDYARKNKALGIVQVIERRRKEQLESAAGKITAGGVEAGGFQPTEEERLKLVVPSGENPALQKACDRVRRKGCKPYPNNFTPLHLAAKLGCEEHARMLLDAGGGVWLEMQDDIEGKRPVDYAIDRGFTRLAEMLDPSAAAGSYPSLDKLSTEQVKPTQSGAADVLRLNELRSQLAKSEAEIQNLQEQIRKKSEPDGANCLSGGIFAGHLDEEQLAEQFVKLKVMGPEGLSMDFQKDSMVGGLGLGPNEAKLAVSQLEFINRITAAKFSEIEEENKRLRVGAGPGTSSALADELKEQNDKLRVELAEAEERINELTESGAAEGTTPLQTAKPKGKGKAKGPPLPGALQPAQPADSSTGKGPKGPPKGKGKAKGPPLPGALQPAQPPLGPKGPAKGPPKGPPKGPGKGLQKGKGPGGPPASKGGGKGPGGPPSSKGKTSKSKGKGKGKGKGGPEPTKKPFHPAQGMKSLQWRRYLMGVQVQPGETVWELLTDDIDLVPVIEMESRFSKNAGLKKVEKQAIERHSKRKIELKAYPGDRMPLEIIVKSLPPVDVLVTAIYKLDRDILTVDRLRDIRRYLCPDVALQGLLTKLRADNPDTPWAPLEHYMWELMKIPACSTRLGCWAFVDSVPEQVEFCSNNIARFERMVDCFRSSETLPSLLSLVLAFGNFLNGGNRRLGQADGFHIEALAGIYVMGLNAVRDPKGRDVRQLIFKFFFTEFEEKAARLVEELRPLFENISRNLTKGEGDDLKLQKRVFVQIEEMDQKINELEQQCKSSGQELMTSQGIIDDPADIFKLSMPMLFKKAEESVARLVVVKDSAMQKFKDIVSWFHCEDYKYTDGSRELAGATIEKPMTSDVWCLIWDDFLVAREQADRMDEKTKKAVIGPRFCQGAPIDLEALQVIWELKDPRKRPKRVRRRQGKRAGIEEKASSHEGARGFGSKRAPRLQEIVHFKLALPTQTRI